MLFCAFASAFTLCWLHTSFVNNSPSTQTNCLFLALNHSNLNHGNLADYDVIRVHITTKENQLLYKGGNATTVERDGRIKESLEECRNEANATADIVDTDTIDQSKHVFVTQPWIYLFSLEKGYLMLERKEERERHGIRRLDIEIPRSIYSLNIPSP